MFEMQKKQNRPPAKVKTQIMMRVTPEEFDAITEEAERLGYTKTYFIKFCLNKHFKSKK